MNTHTMRPQVLYSGEASLACVWVIEKWRTYVWGRKFILRTDHSPLTTLLSSYGLGRAGMRIAHWSACLLSFNYEIVYKPGHQNVTADCLSRLPLPTTEPYHEPDIEMVVLVSGDCPAVPVEQFKETCNRCPILQKV